MSGASVPPPPRPYSLWSLGGAVAWLASVALLAGTASPYLTGFSGFVAIGAGGLAAAGALAFPLLFLHDLVRTPAPSPPPVADARPGPLVVGGAEGPMRRWAGWLPRYVLPAASRRAALADAGLLLVWRGLACTTDLPPAHPACVAVLAAAVVLPPAFIALELRGRRFAAEAPNG